MIHITQIIVGKPPPAMAIPVPTPPLPKVKTAYTIFDGFFP